MVRANEQIRKAANEKGVNLWEIAERFGVNDTTFSRWMRKDFLPDRRDQALKFVDEIAAERK